MTPLALTQMPSPRTGDETPFAGSAGFVDETVALALAAGPYLERGAVASDDLALAADECDFAGWNLAPRPQPERRQNAPAPAATATSARRPQPPALDEPGIGEPHRGGHRWWVAGLAGAFSTLLFTMLLLTLSSRSIPLAEETIFRAPRPAAMKDAPVAEKDAKNRPAWSDLAHGR